MNFFVHYSLNHSEYDRAYWSLIKQYSSAFHKKEVDCVFGASAYLLSDCLVVYLCACLSICLLAYMFIERLSMCLFVCIRISQLLRFLR